MLVKTAPLWYQSLYGYQVICYQCHSSTNRHRPSLRLSQKRCMQSRRNASTTNSNPTWPEIPDGRVLPTPYQIFDQKKGTPYSKARFYELVKLYHPDRYGHDNCSSTVMHLSSQVILERYRLVIAANDILSNPAKRHAYDCYGAGWNGQPEIGPSWGRHGKDSSSSENFWNGAPGSSSPFRNATWEDWERWYNRGNKKQAQQPYFVGNGTFLCLILTFAALGGIGQATRAESSVSNVIERRDYVHDNSSRDLMRRRKDAVTFQGERHEKIQDFMKLRDPIGFGISDPMEESFRRYLPEPEVCLSGDIRSRSTNTSPKDDG